MQSIIIQLILEMTHICPQCGFRQQLQFLAYLGRVFAPFVRFNPFGAFCNRLAASLSFASLLSIVDLVSACVKFVVSESLIPFSRGTQR